MPGSGLGDFGDFKLGGNERLGMSKLDGFQGWLVLDAKKIGGKHIRRNERGKRAPNL